MKTSRTSLTLSEQDALNHLQHNFDENAILTHSAAVDQLTQAGFEHVEAPSLIEQLLQKGYLYKYDGEIHIT